MAIRPITKKSISLPKGVEIPQNPALLFEDLFHTPGQTAAIRFFDDDSISDFEAMREIMKGKEVRRRMDYTGSFSKEDYLDWAGTHTKNNFLYAVLDTRVRSMREMNYIKGFVFLYSEREEKFRVKRMEKLGLLPPATGERHCLEVSFALRPPAPGVHTGSGLIASALRQACLQTKLLLSESSKPDIQIFGFTDPINEPSQHTLEAAGFVKKGKMKYDSDSDYESLLYMLNWRQLTHKIRQKLIQASV